MGKTSAGQRERNKRHWAALKADPIRYAEYREKMKERKRKYRAKHASRILPERLIQYHGNRDFHLEKQREYKRKLKMTVLVAYGGERPACACPGCTESNIEFLTIDHIEGNGAEHRRSLVNHRFTKGGKEASSSANIYRWLVKNNFPPGFRVLCFNCNCSSGNRGCCPVHGGMPRKTYVVLDRFIPDYVI